MQRQPEMDSLMGSEFWRDSTELHRPPSIDAWSQSPTMEEEAEHAKSDYQFGLSTGLVYLELVPEISQSLLDEEYLFWKHRFNLVLSTSQISQCLLPSDPQSQKIDLLVKRHRNDLTTTPPDLVESSSRTQLLHPANSRPHSKKLSSSSSWAYLSSSQSEASETHHTLFNKSAVLLTQPATDKHLGS